MSEMENSELAHAPFNIRDEFSKAYGVKPVKVSSYREMTIETHTTHLSKLKNLNIDPLSLTNKTVLNALNIIKKSGRDDKELSNGYINSIYSTMRRINPSLDKSASKLGFARKNRKTLVTDRLDVDTGVKQMLRTIIKFVSSFTTIEPRKIESRRITDTIIAVTMTLLTNLRSTELFNLRLKHLDMISKNIPILIRSKYRVQEIAIMKTKPLYDSLYPNLINIVLSRELKHNANYLQNANLNSIEPDVNLISCKNDTVNKAFTDLYIRINQQKPNITLGLKTVRSFHSILMFENYEFLETPKIKS